MNKFKTLIENLKNKFNNKSKKIDEDFETQNFEELQSDELMEIDDLL